jgi:hypothetical protein
MSLIVRRRSIYAAAVQLSFGGDGLTWWATHYWHCRKRHRCSRRADGRPSFAIFVASTSCADSRDVSRW